MKKIAPTLTDMHSPKYRNAPQRIYTYAQGQQALREFRAVLAVVRAAVREITTPPGFHMTWQPKACRCALCRALARLDKLSGGAK